MKGVVKLKKGIKTVEIVRNIKVHDSAVNVEDKIKNITLKTKEQALKQYGQSDSITPEQYASDRAADVVRSGSENAVYSTERIIKKGVKKTSEKRAENRANNGNECFDEANKSVGEPIAKTTVDEPRKQENKTLDKKHKLYKPDKNKPDIKQNKQSNPKQRNSEGKTVGSGEKKTHERKQATPKIRSKQGIKSVRNNEKNIKTIDSTQKRIKQSARGSANSKRNIKTTECSAKNIARTTQKNASSAKKSAEVAAKTVKRTQETAKVTAKATVKTVKSAAKATIAAVKATAAVVKELEAVIVTGGWIAVLVIILICLVAAIGGTCFGIFLSNDKTTGSQMTMTSAMSQLTSEYYANLTALKSGFTYDTFEVQSPTGDISINWKDVLAIYAVKTTTSADDAAEVVTIDEKKLEILRTTINDMNTMVGAVTPRVVAETTVTTDAEGNSVKITSYVTKRVLTVVITHLTAQQAAEKYRFTDEQKKQLAELTSSGYDSLWAELLKGSGQIILTDSTWISTGQLSWPLENSNYITSPFGTRADPFTGEIKTHGGIDIAAAEGTPIIAAANGTVTLAGWGDSYGYHVKIAHDSAIPHSTLTARLSLFRQVKRCRRGR